MHDQVLVALISTAGTVIVAFITVYFQRLPPKNDEITKSIQELTKENKKLKEKLKEQTNEHNH
ncbi:hypothetical protein LTY36_04980 [Limosilactobacillus agrestis]|uniref:Holin n=1 Tax=Limosilactobacillus agrestis TaxID=2759748 RepID=A0ABS8RD04_9LACO|nr:hypothetical protein [Limosilactobacillus agrestis]MCD7130544.1 hypothetical protein [Limosilactobacillus agrestis]